MKKICRHYTLQSITVEKGSVWNRTGRGYKCDGEIRLDNEEMSTNEYLRSGY